LTVELSERWLQNGGFLPKPSAADGRSDRVRNVKRFRFTSIKRNSAALCGFQDLASSDAY